jgi:hypothetical protein
MASRAGPPHGGLDAMQMTAKAGGLMALACGQVTIARRQRQAVRRAYGLGTDDLHRYIQLRHHLAHDSELLIIFLAKYRGSGPHDVQ